MWSRRGESNPGFRECLAREDRRRDTGIADAVAEIEAVSGPISEIGERLVAAIKERLDSYPEELSTRELLQYGPQWVRLGLEVEGKLAATKEQGIEAVVANLARGNLITGAMVAQGLDLVREYRELQDRTLAQAGVVERELDG